MSQGMTQGDRCERGVDMEGVVDISEMTVEDFHEFVSEGPGGSRDVSVHRRGAAAYLVAR